MNAPEWLQRDRLPRWMRVTDAAMAMLAGALLLGSAGSYGYVVEGWSRTVAFACCGVLGAWGLACWAWGRWSRPQVWMAAALLAGVLVSLVHLMPLPSGFGAGIPIWREIMASEASIGAGAPSWRPLALAPEDAWAAWHQLLAMTLFLMGVLPLADRRGPALILCIAVATLSVVGGWMGLWRYLSSGEYRASGIVYNANHHAASVACGLAMAVMLLLNLRGTARVFAGRLLSGTNPIVLALMLVGIAALGWGAAASRASLLAVLVTMAIWGAMTLRRWRRAGGKLARHAIPAGILVGLLALAAAQSAVPTLVERVSAGDATGNSRLQLWSASLHGLGETSYLGGGLYSARPLINRHAGFPLTTIPTYSHNDPLQWVVDLGVPGAAIVLVVGGMAVVVLVRERRRTASTVPRHWLGLQHAALAGIMIAGIHAFFDFHLRVPVVGMQVLTLVALFAGRGPVKVIAFRARNG